MGPDYYVTPQSKPSTISRKNIFIGGGLIVAIIIASILLFSGGKKDISTQLQHLSLREAALQTILDDKQTTRNIRNENLSKIITDFSLNLESDVNQLTPLMTDAGLPNKINDSIVQTELDTSTKGKLEAAALNNKLDQVYVEVVIRKIESIQALVAETIPLTETVELQKSLTTHEKHLNDTKKKLEALNL